jgi:hypothetical protein
MNPIFQAEKTMPSPLDRHVLPGQWYFYDETWGDIIGPYESEHEAEVALKAYVEQL